MDWPTIIRRETTALATAATGHLDAPVPACPGWRMRDLVNHVGEVERFWARVVRERLTEVSWTDPPSAPPDTEIIGWLLEAMETVLSAIDGVDPATPIWSWSAQKNAGFVPRRMAHEAAVHRWDGEAAAGASTPIESDLAADGIDELFDLFLPANDRPYAGAPTSVHLHRTDGPGEWLVRLDPAGVVVTRGHEKGDAAVRGPASDLLLLLWRRVPLDRLEVLGDRTAADGLVALFDWE